MVSVIDLIGFSYVLAALAITPVIYVAYKNRERLAGLWLAVISVAIAGVSIVYGLRLILNGYSYVIALDNIKYIFLNIIEVGFLLMAVEYSRKEKWRDWKKLLPIFIGLVVSVQVIVWTNPYHHLMRSPQTYVDANGVLQNDFGILTYVVAILGYIFVIGGIGFFLESLISSRGIYRKQSFIFIIASVVTVIFNIFYALNITYLDLTPVGFALATIIFSWGLFRYEFLEMIPVARKEIMDTMDDAAIVLNNEDRVMDVNASARNLLNLEGDVIGKATGEIFSEYDELLQKYQYDIEARDEIDVIVNGQEKHFDLNISPIEDNTGEVLGRVIVLRDITELKNHEKEIELLKDVQSRVLRHNLRNELGLIRGWAEAFKEKYPEDDETFEKMMEIVDKIIERGEKARTIERILDYSQGVDEVEVTKMVEDSVMSLWNGYPGVDFNTEMPEDVYAYAITDIGIGITNLVENAAEHNDADDPRVEVSVRETDDGWVEIEVWDNGSGIPEAERQIIEEGEETPLRHGSGVGLWLVDWVVSKSNGELVFDTGDGNTVTVRLRASRRSTW